LDKPTPEAMERVRQAVLEQCPELDGVEPTVSARTSPASGGETFVLTFRQRVELEGGDYMTRIVRVTVDEQGQVIKLTASR
jgi:hypothetical protein